MNPETPNPGVSEDEAFVRQRVEVRTAMYSGNECAVYRNGSWEPFISWAGARAFVEKWEREVAELEEEIATLNWFRYQAATALEDRPKDSPTASAERRLASILRTIAARQAALSEKRKGLRETKDSAQPAQGRG